VRVLIVDQFGELGGAQQCLLELLPAFLEAGWTARLAAPAGPYLDRAQALGVAVEELPGDRYASGEKTWRDKWRFAFDAPRLARRLAQMRKEFAPDLFYGNGPRPMPAVALAHRATPVLFHSHNHIPQASAARVLRAALRRSGALAVACCRHAAEPYRDALPAERLRIVYNGTPPASRSEQPEGLRFGVVGRISPEKGQLDFVEAARLAAPRLPGARWMIIGDALFDDPAAKAYRDRVARAAEGYVEMLGWRDDAAEKIGGLDLLAVPSIQEPATPRVIMEAFSRGTPVVAYPTGGIPEILSDGEGGVLLEAPDATKLSETIVGLAGDEARRRRLGEAGHEVWSRRFQLERYQQEMLDAMRAAVEMHCG